MLDISDNRDHIEKADSRWGWISDYVMKKTRSDEGASHYRYKESCRDKWQGIYGDYKRIYDYVKGTGLNERYEDMTPDARAEVGLPRHFSPYHFRLIDSFCKDRPNVHPPHSRDSSDPENNDNFLPNQLPVTDMDTEDIYQDPINLHVPTNLEAGSSWFAAEDTDDNDFMDPPPRRRPEEPSQPVPNLVTPEDLFKHSVSRRGLRSGNTGQKKRQDPEKKKLLEVTEANGASLVAAINRNVDMSREVSDMLSKTQITVCKDQLLYMQSRDSKALDVQRNMVAAISSIGQGLQQLAESGTATGPSGLQHSFARRLREGVEDRREGLLRTGRRPPWWRSAQFGRNRTRHPVSPTSEEECNAGSSWMAGYAHPCTEDAPLPSATMPRSDVVVEDDELPIVEAVNIHPGDALPPVTYRDQHGNVTAGHMEDLTFSASSVNTDNDEDVMA
jgi:hypothetical protein